MRCTSCILQDLLIDGCDILCMLVRLSKENSSRILWKNIITNCNEFQENALKQFKNHFQFTIIIIYLKFKITFDVKQKKNNAQFVIVNDLCSLQMPKISFLHAFKIQLYIQFVSH